MHSLLLGLNAVRGWWKALSETTRPAELAFHWYDSIPGDHFWVIFCRCWGVTIQDWIPLGVSDTSTFGADTLATLSHDLRTYDSGQLAAVLRKFDAAMMKTRNFEPATVEQDESGTLRLSCPAVGAEVFEVCPL